MPEIPEADKTITTTAPAPVEDALPRSSEDLGIESGYGTSEFRALLVVFVMALTEELASWVAEGGMPDRAPWGVLASALAAGLYAVGRSIRKSSS